MQEEVHYYILSKRLAARCFAEAVRASWGIENHLHWQLDVTFGVDDLHLYTGHALANLSIVLRAALGLLKNATTQGGSIGTKRLTAGWNEAYLEKVLAGKRDKTR